jgi:hypothetical protein
MNRHRFYGSVMALAIVMAAAGVGIRVYTGTTSAQDSTALKTPWGDPDLQGIWTDETDTPLQRPAKFANQEFFTPEQRAELDKERAAALGRDRRGPRGSELDVLGAYNAEFSSIKHTGVRTSLIVDPKDGRLPPTTPEARKVLAADREFRLALMQATVTCKQQLPGCRGGKYDPKPTARRNELPPRYNTARMNRHDNPEDGALADRCLTGGLPEFGSLNGGSFRRIVQTPGGVTMYYDVGQGQGWQRNIIMNGSPHLPASIRQWFGDSRGHWEGSTLVIDVTNFSPETDYRGSRENLHLIERWTRTGPKTLSYEVTVEDPTVWIRPWTARQEFTQQSNEENRIYYEPRCWEGDYGFPTIMRNARLEDEAFVKGKGPDPLTEDQASGFGGDDPLENGGQ